ncbi:MAG: hypothetical protein Q9214_001859 [Letrouitia sp. 1 TL-2023]
MVNITASSSHPASLGFGGGLVDIAALTAIIGSTTAKSLILGNRGAAGLVWGTMSFFGTLVVIKACIAAAIPGWLREIIGVKNEETDAALGSVLKLSDKSLLSRQRAIGFCGNGVEAKEVLRQDIYAFDQSTTSLLELVPGSSKTESLQVHVLIPGGLQQERVAQIVWRDWIGILASLIKLLEVTIYWKHEAFKLCLVSGCCWVFFLCTSVLLQAFGLSREYSERVRECEVDILAGNLPTPVKAGGHFKLLLRAPQNVRHSRLWRATWAVGSLVSTASVLAVYMLLGSQDSKVITEWIGFQLLWLVLRSAFYHWAEGTNRATQNPILVKKSWKDLNPDLRARVRGLVQALSLYQMHVHPRCLYCYEEDARTINNGYASMLEYPLSEAERRCNEPVTIFISAVIGDTLLSSACFITGSKDAALDLYDTCVVIVKIKDAEIAIPAARVVTAPSPARVADVEKASELLTAPKGSTNLGKRHLTWWYWIPCGEDLWLEMQTTDMQFLGERRARILSGEQVTKHLASGNFYIGFSEVSQIAKTVTYSRTAFKAMQSLLPQAMNPI